ncbi:MAG TPA: ABC transporter permease subunit [Acidimicrobiia bacterium]|nr:ABC transporter permease subunit [Acidimicrobiia bacterium]
MADTKERKLEAAHTGQPPPEPKKGTPGRGWRSILWIVIAILAGFVIYAYAFETTEVSLDTITDETRQESLFRVIRALGNPLLFDYAAIDTDTDLDYMVPCPADGFSPGPVRGEGGGTLSVDPPCADPGDEVTVSGSGFRGNTDVNIYFVPPNSIELRLAQVRTSADGSFEEVVRLPNRPDEEVQTVRVLSRQDVGSVFNPVYVPSEDVDDDTADAVSEFLDDDVIDSGELAQLPEDSVLRDPEGPAAEALGDGQLTEAELREAGLQVRSPRWHSNAIETLDKIIETVFLALLATTAGTLIAIPLSFIAAKNLMRDVTIPALQVGLAIVGIPIGILIGVIASNLTGDLVAALPDSALLYGATTLVLSWLIVRLLRMSVPMPGSPSSRTLRIASGTMAGILILVAGQSLARFAEVGGASFANNVPSGLAFLGRFVATNGDILATMFTILAALTGAGIIAMLGSRLGYLIGGRAPAALVNVFTVLSMAVAGALVALGFGRVIAWLYQIIDTGTTVWIPMIVGAVVGALIGWRGMVKRQVGAGLSIYYISRTVFNTLRSIEPLVMAIVFVIWVGLGPFAGSLALGLHTVAALAKLYSEQVESINQGPLEAIRATGATRLQTVVYGVVPQIVAPYISFTMYRWDINVRMSTIIGFVGGGGIGFLLQQNIGLLNYRAAAAQMLAIAIVVATMDYISSRLRERFT